VSELQQHERQFLEQQRQSSTSEKGLIADQIAATEYEKQIRDLRHTRSEDLRMAALSLAEALKKLLAEIASWENEFVLRAPADGTVAFYDFWADQQFVVSGKTVFIIAPETSLLLGRIPVAQGVREKSIPDRRCASSSMIIRQRSLD
jgi:multidrug resistance efflux pump